MDSLTTKQWLEMQSTAILEIAIAEEPLVTEETCSLSNFWGDSDRRTDNERWDHCMSLRCAHLVYHVFKGVVREVRVKVPALNPVVCLQPHPPPQQNHSSREHRDRVGEFCHGLSKALEPSHAWVQHLSHLRRPCG